MKTDSIVGLLKGVSLVGAEIGVFGAQLSSTMLEHQPRVKKLFGVDPYRVFDMRAGWPQERWDDLCKAVQDLMATYKDRWELIRMDSLEAVNHLPSEMDFVYLDGNHHYEHVRAELPLYEPKVKVGGIFCGHDYSMPGVRQAVDEYAYYHYRNLQINEPADMWWWRI